MFHCPQLQLSFIGTIHEQQPNDLFKFRRSLFNGPPTSNNTMCVHYSRIHCSKIVLKDLHIRGWLKTLPDCFRAHESGEGKTFNLGLNSIEPFALFFCSGIESKQVIRTLPDNLSASNIHHWKITQQWINIRLHIHLHVVMLELRSWKPPFRMSPNATVLNSICKKEDKMCHIIRVRRSDLMVSSNSKLEQSKRPQTNFW